MLKNFEPNKIFVITSKAPKYVLGLFFIIIFIGLIAVSYTHLTLPTKRIV